ncbi:MAG TPA: glycosyltransferase [Mycobacteriales bacterium]|nr:glycosyltransferase [Mycobacteriales bacterium]
MTLTQAPARAGTELADAVAVRLQRLRAVAPALLGPDLPTVAEPAEELAELLDRMVASLLADRAPDRVWLLMTALSGRLPTDDDVRLALRTLELSDRTTATLWLLDEALEAARAAGTAGLPLELVEGGVVVDVDHTARHDLHTGIQRVVRTTVPRWAAEHDIVEAVWTPGHHAMRRLTRQESDRVHRWGLSRDDVAPADLPPDAEPPDVGPQPLVVPWRSTVVLIEVPVREACERLAAVGQWSGNRVVAVGHDCIPVVSAGLMPLAEPNRFVHYLTAVKHMSTVVGVSVSATREFRGFSDMLPGQGLPGPAVSECALPVDTATAPVGEPQPAPADLPLVLCVGSFEPRKNQLALLWAAEVLWREGLEFRLRFVGGGGWGAEFPRAVRRARRAGRPVEMLTTISEQALDESYRLARFTALVSLHEGYGLPVAESLARSTPALVSDFGSLQEIGAGGGVLTVDPRDDEQVLAGMRRLLTDDALVAELTAQIARRPQRSWDDYARELWAAFDLPAARRA